MDNKEQAFIDSVYWYDDIIGATYACNISFPMTESDLVIAIDRVYDEFPSGTPSYELIESIMTCRNDRITEELLQMDIVK